jgi:hypothetical protein
VPGPAALFEAATMYLYVTARRNRVGGPVSLGFEQVPAVRRQDPFPEPLVCFESPAPAGRFADALTPRLGDSVWVDVRTSGIRHRYEVHGVCVYDEARPLALALLAESWRQGTRLIGDPSGPLPADRGPHRREHAAAAWRALLLAGTPVRRSDALCIRVPNSEFASLLVRAARLLHLPVSTGMDVRRPVLRVADEETVAAAVAGAAEGPTRHLRAVS